MPRLIAGNSERYGIIGITFAILTWLIVVGFGVVTVAVISAELGGAAGIGPGEVAPGGQSSRRGDVRQHRTRHDDAAR
jgi:hypothetical protein